MIEMAELSQKNILWHKNSPLNNFLKQNCILKKFHGSFLRSRTRNEVSAKEWGGGLKSTDQNLELKMLKSKKGFLIQRKAVELDISQFFFYNLQ